MVDWIKCVPFVGTTISLVETVKAVAEGNGKKALWKLGETAVGGAMDVLTVVSVGTSAIATTSAKTAAKVAASAVAKNVAGATFVRAVGTTVAGKEAEKCVGSGGGGGGAKQGRVIRGASIVAQSNQKEQAKAQTGKGDSDSDSEHWSNPECEGDKPDEDDVLTEHDKTKAKLNKNLPKGVKTVGLSKHGPIREVSYETIDGHKIIHYSRSLVTKNDLNTGKDVTARFREIIEEIGIKSIKGKKDDAGHILPRVLGGGLDYNLYPQNPAVNREYFHRVVVQPLIDFLEQNPNGEVEYQVRLIYNPGQTRPFGFYVLTRCYLNDKVYMGFNKGKGYYFGWWPNPHPNEDEY